MFIHTQGEGGPGRIAEATLLTQAQAGCADSLDQLMSRHDGLVGAVVSKEALGRWFEIPSERSLACCAGVLVRDPEAQLG